MIRQIENRRRTSLVTGAAGDLGSAVARRLAARGDRVILVDIREAELIATIASLKGDDHRAVALDLSDEDQVSVLAASLDRLDSLFNAAAINGGSHPIANHPYDDFRRTIEVNLFSVFLTMKHLVPLVAKSAEGWVLNTASEAGLKANERRGAFAASKAAVIQLTRAVALEYGRRGVRVNVLCPGPIEGKFMRRSEDSLPDPERARHDIAAGCSLGRYAQPDEIAIHACYLLCEAPAYVNGAVHLADGCRR